MEKFSSVKYHKIQLVVPLHEIDMGGVVYHGNYLHFYNDARDKFFHDIGYSYMKLIKNGTHLTIAELTCAFKTSVHYDEKISVHTGFSWYSTRSLGISQKIFKIENEDTILCNEASFNMVCTNRTGQAVPLPKEFVDIVLAYNENL